MDCRLTGPSAIEGEILHPSLLLLRLIAKKIVITLKNKITETIHKKKKKKEMHTT